MTKKSFSYNDAISKLVDRYYNDQGKKKRNIHPKCYDRIPTLDIDSLDSYMKRKLKLSDKSNNGKIKRLVYRWIRNTRFIVHSRTICTPIFNVDSLHTAISAYLDYLYYLKQYQERDDPAGNGYDWKVMVWPSSVSNRILTEKQLALLFKDMDDLINSLEVETKVESLPFAKLSPEEIQFEKELKESFDKWTTTWIKRNLGKRSDYRFICHSINDCEDLVHSIVNFLETLNYSTNYHKNCLWMKNILDKKVYNNYIWRTALSSKTMDTTHLKILLEACNNKLPELLGTTLCYDKYLDKAKAEEWARSWVDTYINIEYLKELDAYGNRIYNPITTKKDLAESMKKYIYSYVRLRDEPGEPLNTLAINRIKNYSLKTAHMGGLINNLKKCLKDMATFCKNPKHLVVEEYTYYCDTGVATCANVELTKKWVEQYIKSELD